MIRIGNTLVSDELLTESFCCDVKACLGACCVYGDAGAPLEEDEISILEDELNNIRPYLADDGLLAIENQGVFDYDSEGEYVTPLVNHAHCAFVKQKGEVATCAIEQAWQEGFSKFRKPVSCHLYPVRLKQLNGTLAVNYHRWNICLPGVQHGQLLKLPLYVFLKEALIRKFGQEWYHALDQIAREQKPKV